MFQWLYGSLLINKADRLGTYASALAYCIVLSMIPFLALTFTLGMCLSAEVGQGTLYAEQYTDVLNEIIPTDNPKEISRLFDAVQHSSQSGFFAIGFVVALYTSFNLMEQVLRTVHYIFDDGRRPEGWSWLRVLKTIALFGLWMLMLLIISITAVEASVLNRLLQHYLMPGPTQVLVKTFQLVVVIGALLGTFFLTYLMVPDKRYRAGLVMEGSLLATAAWIASSLIFASVLPAILHSSAAYLALGSVVAILLWAQACAWSVIAGACWIVRFSHRWK